MSEVAVKVEGLSKAFGANVAIRDLNLEIRTGEIFALLGPNGAGKTTTVEILEGHIDRDAGNVTVLGLDPRSGSKELKRRIGIVLQETGEEPFLTVGETVELFRTYYEQPMELDDVLDATGLTDVKGIQRRKLSGGQKRRLDVALGIVGDPDLLFLDEPTTGFDPTARREAWQMLRGLRDRQKSVLLTTHYMEEAETLADRAAIMVNGEIVAIGTPSELIDKQVSQIRFTLSEEAISTLPPQLKSMCEVTDGSVLVQTETLTKTLNELTGWALADQIEMIDLQVNRPSLEDTFVELSREDDV